jgi:hypothetical protein
MQVSPAMLTAEKRRAGLRIGHYVAAAGAMALVVSLFLPWYSLELGSVLGQALNTQAQALPEGLREVGEAIASRLASGLSGTGWEVFEGTDIALLVCAIVVFGLTVLATGISPGISANPDAIAALIAPAGLAATLLVVWKLIDQPDPHQLFSVEPGAFVALSGALAMALGGWGASSQRALR